MSSPTKIPDGGASQRIELPPYGAWVAGLE